MNPATFYGRSRLTTWEYAVEHFFYLSAAADPLVLVSLFRDSIFSVITQKPIPAETPFVSGILYDIFGSLGHTYTETFVLCTTRKYTENGWNLSSLSCLVHF